LRPEGKSSLGKNKSLKGNSILTVFKRANRPCFLVAFKDANGNYLPALSTKKKTEDDAIAVVYQWLRDSVP
jgi:hypothetical protein